MYYIYNYMKDFFSRILFEFGTKQFSVGQLVATGIMILVCLILYRLLARGILARIFTKEFIEEESQSNVKNILKLILFSMTTLAIMNGLKLDFQLFENQMATISISNLVWAFMVFQIARLFNWFLSEVILKKYFKIQSNQNQKTTSQVESSLWLKSRDKANQVIKYAVFLFTLILVIRNFQLDYTIIAFEDYNFKISNILWAFFIIALARLLVWIITHVLLYNYYRRNSVNIGSQYAINQLMGYVVYIIAMFMAFESLGVQMTVLWGGAAALLVGVGLALQQTFNDLISGIILLFERSVEVGDIVEIGTLIGSVKRIGLRASIVETRANITVVVPNSKLIIDNVVNWSHFDDKVRFMVNVGVAYGSDIQLVKKILLDIAKDNVYLLQRPAPFVRFINFGDSSLDFELHFFCRNFIVIEDIKSDLRFEIDLKFREHDVSIPFPQRDIWMKKS